MKIFPKDLLEQLEFDKVRNLIEGYCTGSIGKALALRVRPSADRDRIVSWLQEASEMAESLSSDKAFPQAPYLDLEDDLRFLEVEGSVLSEEALLRIAGNLRAMQGVIDYFSAERQALYPALYQWVEALELNAGLVGAIDRVVDEEGKVRPDASPGLQAIRRAIGGKQKELDRQFRALANTYRNKGWLSDNVESFRNGRRVLSVPSEHKRKIRGIIHDESTSGKTAFIEPEAVIEINNDIFDLEVEEKREIYRLLKALSAELRPWVPDLRKYQALLGRFDLLQAKGRLGLQLNGVSPQVLDHPHLGWIEARHPLLFLKNRELEKETIPFDLQLSGPNRLLVLSGPNAGGKSITMKTVGLLQLMVQSGLLVPADERSEVGIFGSVFADIGDQQSIEDDLSTYSSRLRNMRSFLQRADDRSLIVIDEFGSGTDPKIGGAIAEAILVELNRKGVSGVITTHYSNLKIFAFKTEGILNGAMAFDKEHLSPTYRLSVGRPGSSYAFEIASKSGLGKAVLRYAREKTGASEKAVDELLVDLQQQKKELEEQLRELAEKEAQLDRLVKNYDRLHRDLEYKRKKLKLANREQELQQNAREKQELDRLIREIKEEKNLEKARELANRRKEARENLSEKVQELREEVHFRPDETREPIREGDHVLMLSGESRGVVESLGKGKAIVQVGQLRMTVPLRELKKVDSPLAKPSGGKVKMDTVAETARFEQKIDIRGMRMDEALKLLEKFLDEALLANAAQLEIIHGKGTGVLRKAVWSKLREYRMQEGAHHPAPERGGNGVTLVELG